MMLASC